MAKYDIYPEIVKKYESLHSISKLREIVRRLWHIEVAFADPEGFVIDHARGKISPSRNQFCHKCLFDKEGLKKCDRTVADITAKLKSGLYPQGGVFEDCHVGFKYVAVPVIIDGQFLGSVFGGGFITEDLSDQAKARILERTSPFRGTVIASPDAALDEIPRLTAEEVRFFREIILFGVEEAERYYRELITTKLKMEEINLALEERYAFHSIVGRGPAMQRLYALLDKLKQSESTVLIQGDNGTGKEMVAKAVHFNSPRREQRFITQNCSAFNENLLDSELFGHVKGSFTGAVRDKKGLFEVANGGTFFMDEIGDMSPALQVKVLRVLQEGVFIPVGGTEPRHVDVRIIAATNRDLKKMVQEGTFREDLYYRINVINIHVPALRDRREDIPLLVEHFLRKHYRGAPENQKRISPEAMDALIAYNWPGNVRQLENEIQRAIVLAGDSQVIPRDMLSPTVTSALQDVAQVRISGKLKDALEHVERQVILEGLRRHRWNKSRLSKELGISRATLIWKVEKYGFSRPTRA